MVLGDIGTADRSKQPAGPVQDPQARLGEIETILADIQKSVRYTGIEFGMSAYVPRSPQQTIARGSGDGKDKSALFISRLRAVGIAANLALLTRIRGLTFETRCPG